MADNETAETEVDAPDEVPQAVVEEAAVLMETEEAPSGVGREAVEGILSQIEDSKAILATASSAKIQKAVGKLTEATTWLKDALKG